MNIVSREKPLNQYQWGNGCDGWDLLADASLSVKLERMPPHSSEQVHSHLQVQQFFFILKGEAVFEIDQERLKLGPMEGIHIRPGQRHRIFNEGTGDLEFLLSSQPPAGKDRINHV